MRTMSTTPSDYAALFRSVIGEWQNMTNPAAGQPPKGEAFRGMVERTLAAANMPTRAEIEDISARLTRIEGALFRMEAKLAELTDRET